jgi:putative spermidine/putrescine transport system permease protein
VGGARRGTQRDRLGGRGNRMIARTHENERKRMSTTLDSRQDAPQNTQDAPALPRRRALASPSLRDWLAAGQWFVTLALCAFLIVPIVMSIIAGLTVNYFRGVASGLTLRWLGEVWTQYHASVFLSLEVAAATLVITLITGVPAGYALARSNTRLARVVEELLVLPVALPGLASALALLVVYGGFTAFRMSAAFIVVGHVVFTLPFMVRAVAAVCASAGLRTLEEGAASLGATFRQRFVTIVLPNIRPGIVAGALAVVTLSIGEFNLTWMLHTPDTKTLPVGLADTYASMRIEIGSAYTILFFIMTMPLLVAMQWLGVDATGQRRATRTPKAAATIAPATRLAPSDSADDATRP